ncbi:hypothetical protein F4861DRAFT_123869 [Xylaria intraflava]|nr:hypothetical protein F4861DRAFT_123869 [Xylaria intraflava]
MIDGSCGGLLRKPQAVPKPLPSGWRLVGGDLVFFFFVFFFKPLVSEGAEQTTYCRWQPTSSSHVLAPPQARITTYLSSSGSRIMHCTVGVFARRHRGRALLRCSSSSFLPCRSWLLGQELGRGAGYKCSLYVSVYMYRYIYIYIYMPPYICLLLSSPLPIR